MIYVVILLLGEFLLPTLTLTSFKNFKMAVREQSGDHPREKIMKTDNKTDKKVYLVAQELKLARVLAGNNKTSRDKALKSLKKWFSHRSKTLRMSLLTSNSNMIYLLFLIFQLLLIMIFKLYGRGFFTPCGCPINH